MNEKNHHFHPMKFEYPAKILIAWGEAISGNKDIRDFLIANGYPELGLFAHALRNQDDAREWLMANGFPHLMALINGAEGNPNALLWLKKYDLDILEKMARVGDNDENALLWLLKNGFADFANIAQRIRRVKNSIEEGNNDVHRISAD